MHDVQQPSSTVGRHLLPATLEEALHLLSAHGGKARIVAGGTDLMVDLDRGARPDLEALIDITRIPGLTMIHEAPDVIHLGPLVTHNQCATDPLIVNKALPLAQASLEVGSPALRNRATVVGNIVTASPANDTISALVALGATVSVATSNGQRVIPLSDFYTGVRQTILADDELVTDIAFPALQPNERGLFLKLGLRKAQAISIVHMAVVLGFDERGPANGAVTSARLALGSVAPTIVRSAEAEAALLGGPLDADRIARCAELAAGSVSPIDDHRAGADYRSELIDVMVRRALSAIRRGEERLAFPQLVNTLGGPNVLGTGVEADLSAGSMIEAVVNGGTVSGPWVDGTMLDWLRESAALTGTKEGCAEGECGACTVHLDGASVLSCLVPSGRAHKATIVTIEGLAEHPALHPLQQSFIDEAAVQCGFCIPGFLMAGASLLADHSTPTPEQLELGLSGNLCRCTGYYKIVTAFDRASGGAE